MRNGRITVSLQILLARLRGVLGGMTSLTLVTVKCVTHGGSCGISMFITLVLLRHVFSYLSFNVAIAWFAQHLNVAHWVYLQKYVL